MSVPYPIIFQGDCTDYLNRDGIKDSFALTFLDPPFNQGKDYAHHDDDLPDEQYWDWMTKLCHRIHTATQTGGALYFMQREKNSEFVLRCLRQAGWTLQNLIIWKKLTSAVPSARRYGKHYQIIAYATKGKTPRIFNRLRIDPPLPAHYKYERENGMFVTDVWDDIRELTAGYFAGDEAMRKPNGERIHKQQAPIALLLRILLTSTRPDDLVFDPFSGTGTTGVVAQQLSRHFIGCEIDPLNAVVVQERLNTRRDADNIHKYRPDYRYTPELNSIWIPQENHANADNTDVLDLPLFRFPSQE
jgi:DNA modification methylase